MQILQNSEKMQKKHEKSDVLHTIAVAPVFFHVQILGVFSVMSDNTSCHSCVYCVSTGCYTCVQDVQQIVANLCTSDFSRKFAVCENAVLDKICVTHVM